MGLLGERTYNTSPKFIKILLAAVLLIGVCLPISARAVQTGDLSFAFELTMDGEEVKEVSCGDVITITAKLKRTDDNAPYTMYAMQDEVRYDGEFFELVESGTVLTPGISSTDIATTEQFREFYLNFLSMSGGTQWDAATQLGTIQLKVIGTHGVSKITHQDFLVSTKDGSSSYPCEANEVTVVVSTDCTVKFETRGGSEISPQTVQYGEKILRPDDPSRDGYQFDGWYADLDLTDEWDFEADSVEKNMTLYAKWVEEEQPVKQPVFSDKIGLYGCALLFLLILFAVLIGKCFCDRKQKGEQE